MKIKFFALLCAATLVACNSGLARSADDNDIATITDVTLVRPCCFCATLIGSAIFVVALPFAAASGSVHATADTLVLSPAEATFTRPVGDFTSIQ